MQPIRNAILPPILAFAGFVLLFLSGCMKAEKISTDTSGAQGFVLGGLSLGVIGGSSSSGSGTGGGGTGGGATVLPTLSYSSPLISVQNTAITPVSATLVGTPLTGCTSSPALPNGLSIDPASCTISGSPVSAQIAASYTITATNALGAVHTTISISTTANASRVYNPSGSISPTATSLSNPAGVAVDSSGNLYVADKGNSRVLFFPANTTTATLVYGQSGNFTTGVANNGGVTANSLYSPTGIAVDPTGNLYVPDYVNSRILFYPTLSITATVVYGQTNMTAAGGGSGNNKVSGAEGVAFGSSGIYIADFSNNRVLFFTVGSTTASKVYGQGGSYAVSTPNTGGVSANSLYGPEGVAVDSSGGLYVADSYNNRVLFFPAGSTTATKVYGQGGSYVSGIQNHGGISADSMSFPTGVVVDSSGGLYVADQNNNRVLFFPTGSTTATRVYGQPDTASNAVGYSYTGLRYPTSVAVDSLGGLYVADAGNNRVLYFPP